MVMDGIGQDALRTLKNQQYWIAFGGLLRLQNRLHRYGCANHVVQISSELNDYTW